MPSIDRPACRGRASTEPVSGNGQGLVPGTLATTINECNDIANRSLVAITAAVLGDTQPERT